MSSRRGRQPKSPESPKLTRSLKNVVRESDISKLRESMSPRTQEEKAARVKASKLPSSVNDKIKSAISSLDSDIRYTRLALERASSLERSHLSGKLAVLRSKKALYEKQDLSRYMRNQQSSINRDIKSTEKAIARTKDSTERRNLEHRLSELQNLKETMAASFKGTDGEKVYNPANARIDALNEYLTKFKGASHLEEQRAYQVKTDLSYSAEFQRRFEKKWRDAVDQATDDRAYANTVEYQELYDDYLQAVRSFDSEEAKRVVSKMESGRTRYYEDTAEVRINQGRKAK